ncbi:MAG: agmatine deiminase family protein [Acidobacteriaceae bacterium]|nr:agmatine deiminase family protein [Acidobacteriaceae bacterium]
MTTARTRMPAEWAPHAATWIAWPHNPEDWPNKFQPIPWVYAEIVRHLSRVEDVHILVNDEAAERRATGILKRGGANLARVRFHQWPTDRVWLRDSGPIFVKDADGKIAVTNWKFNAWAKYDNWRRDDQIPHHVARLYSIPEIKPEVPPAPADPKDKPGSPTSALAREGEKPHRIVLEGGSIDCNGAGALLTTEECLLSEIQQRNPGLGDETTTKHLLEQAFHQYLGIDQTLWLNRGCAGDDTHGHVDDIARFVAEDTIVAAVEPNVEDDNHLPLAENLDRLRSFRRTYGAQKGMPFRIVELPMPAPVVFEGQRLPASYANFYIANGLVIVPTFNDANDRRALNILAECFPTREVVGIHAVDLVWGLGTLHCLSQQEPA